MKDLKIFNTENYLKKVLRATEKKYRPYDAGWYLYRQILQSDKDKYGHEFIELVYATLSAWNMNSRGARLNDFDLFEKTIKENKRSLKYFTDKSIKDIVNNDIQNRLKKLFFELKLVGENKPPLVTFSKFLHFYFPELIVPIDRTYTCRYFYNNTSIPQTLDGQFKNFIQIEEKFSEFSQKHDLKKYLTKTWALCETKVMDNMIIGHIMLKEKKRHDEHT
jgi:hypothetical protein